MRLSRARSVYFWIDENSPHKLPAMNLVKKEIVITGDTVLGDIQKTFNSFFPFLKIEFYKLSVQPKTARDMAINPHTLVKALTQADMPPPINRNNIITFIPLKVCVVRILSPGLICT